MALAQAFVSAVPNEDWIDAEGDGWGLYSKPVSYDYLLAHELEEPQEGAHGSVEDYRLVSVHPAPLDCAPLVDALKTAVLAKKDAMGEHVEDDGVPAFFDSIYLGQKTHRGWLYVWYNEGCL